MANSRFWVDANGNGVTDAGELKTLAEVGITSVNLVGRNLEGTAKVGDNVLISTSTFTRSNGSTGTAGNAALAYTPGKGAISHTSRGSREGSLLVPDQISIDAPFDGAIVGQDGIAANTEALVAVLRNTRSSFTGGGIGFGLDLPFNVDPFEYFANADEVLALDNDINNRAVKTTNWLRDVGTSIEAISDVQAAVLDAQAVNNPFQMATSTSADRLLAIIAQDMASFGARSGEDSRPWREGVGKPVEFFA